MQHGQKIDGGLVARLDRRRRIAADNAFVAEILHDDESAVEIGVENGRRRKRALAQSACERDVRHDVFGEMGDGAIGLAVANRRTVRPARRVHQNYAFC